MSAVLQAPEPLRRTMTQQDLDAVLAIEHSIYGFPWTRGNFADSLRSGYWAQVLCSDNALVGYGVLQPGAGESHVLNITLAQPWQRQGLGLTLLDAMVVHARERHDEQLWLEVRPSNTRARQVYSRYGFTEVGRRRAYYPAVGGREDALVLRLNLPKASDAVD